MPEDQCTLTELPKSGCAHCRGHDSRPAASDRLTEDDIGARFEAGYDGRCEVCGGRIRAGDVIARLTDGSGYACEGCLS